MNSLRLARGVIVAVWATFAACAICYVSLLGTVLLTRAVAAAAVLAMVLVVVVGVSAHLLSLLGIGGLYLAVRNRLVRPLTLILTSSAALLAGAPTLVLFYLEK